MIEDIAGIWDMVHDGMGGTLKINPSDQRHNAIEGNCTYNYNVIEGNYNQGNGASLQMHGTFGGKDVNNRSNAPCKQSDHLISFTIHFPPDPPQQFTGYLFTHNKKTMAGFTWWKGIPFGWFATKRS